MYLNTVKPVLATGDRILIFTEERTLKEDLRLSHALQKMDHSSSSTMLQPPAKPQAQARPPLDVVDFVSATNEKEALALVEAAAQEHRPFSVIIMDGRMFQGKDYRQVILRMWQIQRDLHIVLHAVSHIEACEQIPLELGSPHQLLVLKSRLVPFEITQVIRTLTAKHGAEHKTSHRDLSLNAQILESAKRFEDVSNQLRLEQEHRRHLEERICRNQRLETTGRFSDAMAHFFNNYLTVIQGHLGIALAAGHDHSRSQPAIEELVVATKHAADITSQFVAFNRREYLQPGPVYLAQVIDSQASLLQKALGEQITVQISHKHDLPCVMADAASLEQIIFNLLIHARDTMPQGGRITIQTRELRIPDASSAHQLHPDAQPGHYVVMDVSDTGKGMTADELARLFDSSRLSQNHAGDGDITLVLAQGMVRLQGGWITASSVPEMGTEFSIYLPVAAEGAQAPSTPDKKLMDASHDSGSSTILVVDDEDSVRQVIEYVLTSQGHNVLSARDANEAWTLWRANSTSIALAIIDIQLPGGVSGFDLERAITEERAILPVIFTCGYSPTKLSNSKELKTGENFLPKPFGMVELLNIVGQALSNPVRA